MIADGTSSKPQRRALQAASSSIEDSHFVGGWKDVHNMRSSSSLAHRAAGTWRCRRRAHERIQLGCRRSSGRGSNHPHRGIGRNALPDRQAPQAEIRDTSTRSPAETVLTPVPTSSTVPTASWPRIRPTVTSGVSPFECKSDPQIVVTQSLTMASVSSRRDGCGTSSTLWMRNECFHGCISLCLDAHTAFERGRAEQEVLGLLVAGYEA